MYKCLFNFSQWKHASSGSFSCRNEYLYASLQVWSGQKGE